jgi:hypothetical protein
MVKTVQVMKTAFQSDDGKTYDNEIDALRADEAFRAKSDHVFHFGRTFSGKRLLEKYDLSKYGIWCVKGEDPNCDMGGYHHEPLLGYFEGTLEQVINKAYTLERWMTWGGGGSITLAEPEKITKL